MMRLPRLGGIAASWRALRSATARPASASRRTLPSGVAGLTATGSVTSTMSLHGGWAFCRRAFASAPPATWPTFTSASAPSTSTASSAAPSSPSKPFYVTTPIFYVNAAPHLGHLFSVLLAESLTAWRQAQALPAAYMVGTDEHGIKVQEAAAKAGAASPLAFCDRVSAQFSAAWDKYGFQPALFARTTAPDHERHVQDMWRKLQADGHIYLGEHSGWCVALGVVAEADGCIHLPCLLLWLSPFPTACRV